ncbi:tetratricopeptide repeat protein [Moorena producens JHB]|uniref:Tetratricopeptide repeat protein n=1 Tax=Moorena producens (strain JHB) TaxID=1454205 RepID=A0A1D9G979_MOOP1|nr:tetratricopeptide repeat protein [Moorena producens]AOY84209.1 tetratricopeptide repeat protein [Moorena producens JHB]
MNYLFSCKSTIQALLSLTLMGWTTPVWSNPNAIHILLYFKGNVQVKKTQWSKFNPADYGITLNSNDQIKLGSKASVTIYCSNQNPWKVTQPGTYIVSQGCPTGEPVIRLCPDSNPDCNNDTRRPTGTEEKRLQQLPYLISPRHTLVFNDSFTLRWNGVSGTTQYTIKVGDWKGQTNETQIVYDGELEPGYSYYVKVSADNRVFSTEEDEDRFYSKFKVLEEEEAKTLQEQVAVIKQQELSQAQEALILAYFYRGHELNTEAIQVLERLVKSGSQTTTVYQLLGDIYQQVGLTLMAKEVYGQGLALTREEENSDVKAMMQWGLAEVEYTLANRDEAVELLDKAKASYSALGNQIQVKTLAKRIDFILEMD